MTAQPGDVLAGKYRVEKILGTGAMGIVVAATHLELQRQVALKFMLPEMAKAATAADRFLREARAAAKLQSEHVCRVSDVGRLENGAPYIVMEYLEGGDLAAVLRTRGPLVVSDAVDYVLQACEAMAEAHGAGIIHRDLKPENLFLAKRSRGASTLKVLDFGISKATFSESETQTNTVMGSPGYMSPEQWKSAKHVDARTDIYALGVILFELVGGVLPFVGETMGEVCTAVLHDPPRPLAHLRRGLPAGFEAVVSQCLAKDPNDRYQTVSALATALAPFASSQARESLERIRNPVESAAAIDSPVSSVTRALSETTLGSAAAQSLPPQTVARRSGRKIAVAAAGLAAATAGILFAAGTFSSEGAPSGSEIQPAAPAPSSPTDPRTASVTPDAGTPALAPDAGAAALPAVEEDTATSARERRKERRAAAEKAAIEKAAIEKAATEETKKAAEKKAAEKKAAEKKAAEKKDIWEPGQ